MAQPNPTRRALIGAATTALAYAGGAAIVGTGIAVASEARGATPSASDRAAWDRAVALAEKARREDDEINAIHCQMDERHQEALSRLAPLSRQCRRHFMMMSEQEILAIDANEHERDWFASRGMLWGGGESAVAGYRAIYQEVRDRQKAVAAINGRLNVEAIDAEWNRRGEVCIDAEDAVFDTPAPHIDALAWKIRHVKARGLLDDDLADMLLADAARLAGKAVLA